MNEHESPSSEANEEVNGADRRSVPKIGLKTLDPLWNVSTETRYYIEGCLRGIFERKYATQGASA
jgi:hypothetical protein